MCSRFRFVMVVSASGIGISGRSGRVRQDQQVGIAGMVGRRRRGGAVAVRAAAAAGQESTPTARPLPLYR
jgi:hypothetical protein